MKKTKGLGIYLVVLAVALLLMALWAQNGMLPERRGSDGMFLTYLAAVAVPVSSGALLFSLYRFAVKKIPPKHLFVWLLVFVVALPRVFRRYSGPGRLAVLAVGGFVALVLVVLFVYVVGYNIRYKALNEIHRLTDVEEKIRRYLEYYAEHQRDRNAAYLLFNISNCYFINGELENAVHYNEEFISVCRGKPRDRILYLNNKLLHAMIAGDVYGLADLCTQLEELVKRLSGQERAVVEFNMLTARTAIALNNRDMYAAGKLLEQIHSSSQEWPGSVASVYEAEYLYRMGEKDKAAERLAAAKEGMLNKCILDLALRTEAVIAS